MAELPKTTPECQSLLRIVLKGANANIFDEGSREAARVALQRLYKKRCTKSLEYVVEKFCGSNILDTFRVELCKTATEYLKKLS